MGNGQGGFKPRGTDQDTSDDPFPVAIGDFNEDGHLDFATASTGFSSMGGGVVVWFGTGLGTFINRLDLSAGVRPGAITAADVNEDDHPGPERRKRTGYHDKWRYGSISLKMAVDSSH